MPVMTVSDIGYGMGMKDFESGKLHKSNAWANAAARPLNIT